MLIDSITPILDRWAEAQAIYRSTNRIPWDEPLNDSDWDLIEQIKFQLQMTEGGGDGTLLA